MTTIVLLFAAATALTRAAPLCQAFRSFRSPAWPSTVMYSSPESDVMNTMAVSAFWAADAPWFAVSDADSVTVAPSDFPRFVMASAGSLRYYKN